MISDQTSQVSYAGNGSLSTPYPITFRYDDSAWVLVEVIDEDGVISELDYGTDFTITGNGATTTGNIVTGGGAIPATSTLRITRDTARTQTLSLTATGALPSSTIESQLDRHTMALQDIERERAAGLERSLRVPDGQILADLTTALRSGKFLGFDDDGNLAFKTAAEILADSGGAPTGIGLPAGGGQYDIFAKNTATDYDADFQPTSEQGFNLLTSFGSSARREAVKRLAAVPAQANPKPAAQARVVFVCDDGPTTDLTFLKPIFDNDSAAITGLGLTPKTYAPTVGTLAIISSFVGTGGNLSAAQLLDFQSDGWEIASHTKNHLDLSLLSYADCETQCADSYNSLRALGLEVNNLVYPFGGNNKQVREIVAKYYRSAVAVITNNAFRNAPPCAQYSLNRYGIESDSDWTEGDIATVAGTTGTKYATLQDRKNLVDRTIVEGGMIVFMVHSAALSGDLVRAQILIDLLEYIHAKAEFTAGTLQITTLDEALDTHGNILTTGDFVPYPQAGYAFDHNRASHHVIDCLGASHVYPRHDVVSYEGINGRNNASAASAYTMGRITMIGFTTAEALAASLPGSVEGILEMWRLFPGDYSTRQFWYPYGVTRKWSRFWQPGSSTWSAWVMLEDATIFPSTTMAMDDQGATAVLRINFTQSTNIRSRIDGGFSSGNNMILWAGSPLSQIITLGNGNRSGVNIGWSSIGTLPPAEGAVSHSDIVVNTTTKGLVLKSPNAHYWRATISDAGTVTWADLGTTSPA